MTAQADSLRAGETATKVRPVTLADRPAWLAMRHGLWPDVDTGQHERDVARILENRARETALLCLGEDGAALGFVEISRRQFVDGCPGSPVGYVEALYVAPACRRRSVARALVDAAEGWARARGCRELASGAGIDDEVAQAVHGRLGFEETARLVLYRKPLAPAPSPAAERPDTPSSARPSEPLPGPVPIAASGAGSWRPGTANVVVFVLGVLAFFFTDVFSDNLFYGAVLPIVDVLFVMYVIALIVVVKYRSKTAMGTSREIHEMNGGREP